MSEIGEEPLLPERSGDESEVGWAEVGWAEMPDDPADADVRRLTEDRPPHHDRGW